VRGAALKDLPASLNSLDLSDTAVADEEVYELSRLSRCNSLSLQGTLVGAETVRILRRAWPHCRIEH